MQPSNSDRLDPAKPIKVVFGMHFRMGEARQSGAANQMLGTVQRGGAAKSRGYGGGVMDDLGRSQN